LHQSVQVDRRVTVASVTLTACSNTVTASNSLKAQSTVF
jgi:hypothetical protein